ncbi:hypothetical protein RRG08_060885 [Elysia crispata]|uniref:Uncharacterized protein n=1 Tax=Elysia crispata TaxID=231223 RepID=A0AAE1DF92_9GAST|nr:hypothetical protein RRG08_060885 [Elysia crispata]
MLELAAAMTHLYVGQCQQAASGFPLQPTSDSQHLPGCSDCFTNTHTWLHSPQQNNGNTKSSPGDKRIFIFSNVENS